MTCVARVCLIKLKHDSIYQRKDLECPNVDTLEVIHLSHWRYEDCLPHCQHNNIITPFSDILENYCLRLLLEINKVFGYQVHLTKI